MLLRVQMTLQILIRFKNKPAIALERGLAVMNFHVVGQGTAVLKSLGAVRILTLQRPLVSMNQHMLI
jgi:hypothetical protein